MPTFNMIFLVLCRSLAALIACGFAVASDARAGGRVALVIGNGNYTSVDRLRNPANDARLIGTTLQSMGFNLVGGDVKIDLSKSAFDRALGEFGHLIQNADIALFYYAGHGIEASAGLNEPQHNWLVPIDATITTAADIELQLVNADFLLHQMAASRNRLRIMILDACRSNPFRAAMRDLGTDGGLGDMAAPPDTVIAYATSPGRTAADGRGSQDGPYAIALANALPSRELDILHMFNQVGRDVRQRTGDKQTPWVSISPLQEDNLVLAAPVPMASSRPPPGPVAARVGPAGSAASAWTPGWVPVNGGECWMWDPHPVETDADARWSGRCDDDGRLSGLGRMEIARNGRIVQWWEARFHGGMMDDGHLLVVDPDPDAGVHLDVYLTNGEASGPGLLVTAHGRQYAGVWSAGCLRASATGEVVSSFRKPLKDCR